MNMRLKNRITFQGRAASHDLNGFTVLELLVSVFLAAIVTTAAMSLYITQHKQLLVQDEISDMQANVRAATAELTTKIRMAGYKVPDPSMAIRTANSNPDTIALAFDTGENNNIQISHAMPQPSAELRCEGYDISGLHDNDILYIFDPTARVGEFFVATNVQYGSSHIQHNTTTFSRSYPAGSLILKIRRCKYYIDNTTDANHPNFMIQVDNQAAQVFAENISSLNFSYKLSSGAIVDVAPVPDMIREVLITVNARTDKADREFSSRQYRTRTLATRVKVRNLGVN
jgi:hypothetical protein